MLMCVLDFFHISGNTENRWIMEADTSKINMYVNMYVYV